MKIDPYTGKGGCGGDDTTVQIKIDNKLVDIALATGNTDIAVADESKQIQQCPTLFYLLSILSRPYVLTIDGVITNVNTKWYQN